MSPKSTIAFALLAGLLGGLASRALTSLPVYAKDQPAQSAPAAQELRARKFVLVDETGVPRGVLGFEKDGSSAIELGDGKGKVFKVRLDSILVDVFRNPKPSQTLLGRTSRQP